MSHATPWSLSAAQGAPILGAMSERNPRSFWSAVRHGSIGRCPKCGRGHLFRAYLKPVDSCVACGEIYRNIRADDGPAWLTILIAGHIVVGSALLVERYAPPPLWISMSLFPALALGLALGLLPVTKGIFIGAIWATKAPGFE